MSPAKLHRIRNDAKKLRYMCEFVESLVKGGGEDRYRLLVDTLKKLQKVLGRMHDGEAHAEFLQAIASEAEREPHAPRHVPVDTAIEGLLAHESKGAGNRRRKMKKWAAKLRPPAHSRADAGPRLPSPFWPRGGRDEEGGAYSGSSGESSPRALGLRFSMRLKAQ